MGCQPEFFRGFTDLQLFSNKTKILQNLYKKVANTFISTARSQHQGSLSFMIFDIHTYTCIQQQIHYVVMPNVAGIHQRWPPTHIFLVQVNFPIGIKVFWMTNPSDTYICRWTNIIYNEQEDHRNQLSIFSNCYQVCFNTLPNFHY